MTISDHAMQRGQQRGIRRSHMDILYKYGRCRQRRGGAVSFTLDHESRQHLLETHGHDKQIIDKLRKQVLICSLEGQVITVYHRDRFSKHGD
jgi:hypothetical protein